MISLFPILSYYYFSVANSLIFFVHLFREVEFQVECTWKTIPWPMVQGCPLGVFITRPICPLQLVSPEFPRTLCQTPFIMIVTTGKRKAKCFSSFFLFITLQIVLNPGTFCTTTTTTGTFYQYFLKVDPALLRGTATSTISVAAMTMTPQT